MYLRSWQINDDDEEACH